MTSISPYILEQLRARDAIPKATPAYLATAGSPLKVDTRAYTDIQVAPRVLLADFTLPIRSGRAWEAPAGSIIKISTPEGPQVGMCSPALPNGSSGPKLSPSRPGDLNIWNRHNPRERFWASRTRQLYASHVSTHDRLWSCLPYLRPMATILHDSLAWYGIDRHGGRVHDLLGTRCDPYVNTVLAGEQYDFHCHSNLTRAVAPFGLAESDVHDVINIFQVTGLDEQGRYFMNPCPAQPSDCIEFLAEQDLLMALSTCPGGDLSAWGFGSDNEKEMIKCCRPLRVQVYQLQDETLLSKLGWTPAQVAPYKGMHGVVSPLGDFVNQA
ncbi:meiotic chromosome segregation protein [Moelleriella libera RCEF 2490]|uniref:Meiotic chromosome segregation protein n=1 Tax=Moelleriella libera RCEF 2490 TaxID=1081109 RepID=A0A166V388_9HYPO|nr:meiotic chromosome segregation protein [Moelleriella libera RCEF 2490]